MGELFLLVGPTRAHANPQLLRIKVSDMADENPILGFASEELGRSFMKAHHIASEFYVVPLRQLEPSRAAEAQTRRVLLLDSPERLNAYLEHSEPFDYSTYTTSFEDAQQRVQVAP